MIKAFFKMIGSACLILIGLVFIEMIFTDPSPVGTKILMFVFAIPFIGVGVIFTRIFWSEFNDIRHEEGFSSVKNTLVPGFEKIPDRTDLESRLTRFRKKYSDFFAEPQTKENAPIGEEVTQLFRNMLDFRKNRLKRLGLTCEMEAVRMLYTDKNSLNTRTFSDGKYDITEVTEEISAKTIYKKNGKEIYTKNDRDLADYTLIHAKDAKDGKIICPNCGCETTRTALLDGCDYCGTKFTVEDLGTNIAEFALKTDYEIENIKYKKTRNKVILWIMIIAALIVIGWASYWMIKVFPEVMADTKGIFLPLVSALGAIALACAFIIPFVWFICSWFVVPVVIAIGSYNQVSKKVLKQLKDDPSHHDAIAKRVRQSDPLFSIGNFYAGLQNKLASIVYADTKTQIQAFAGCDLTNLLGRYSNVVGIDMERLMLTDYRTDKDWQYARAKANMRFTEYHNGKCRLRREAVELMLVKSAACKTQVVCAPSIMTCKGCGTSLNLLNGKFCAYCGRPLVMEHYDWIITGYQITK